MLSLDQLWLNEFLHKHWQCPGMNNTPVTSNENFGFETIQIPCSDQCNVIRLDNL